MTLAQLPDHVAGLANLTVLIFFISAGLYVAAALRSHTGVGAIIGVIGWGFFLMAPSSVRVGNLFLLAVALSAGSSAMSGAGYGAMAARHGLVGGFFGTLALGAAAFVPFAPQLFPAGVIALVLHIAGLSLAASGMLRAVDAAFPGASSSETAAVCTLLCAIFAATYLPLIWPAWPLLHTGIAGVAFLGTYAGNR